VTPQRVRSLSLADWNGLEALSGVARIQACTMEQFVPQMVNFDLTGGVSFQKGCYPGQEVVARSQYRGTIKRRSHTYASAEALTPGQGVFDAEDPDQPAGQVVLAGHWPGAGPAPAHAGVALVEVKLAALASGRLHAGRPDGPLLTALELPYSLPQDAH
jgi:folate-binding protein YgfZ